jgi:hypothetical protein
MFTFVPADGVQQRLDKPSLSSLTNPLAMA